MSRLIAFCAWLLPILVSFAAEAADDPMATYYENTLTCQGGETDNWLCYYWYYPGGYFREMQAIRRRDGNMALHGREGTFKVTTTRTGTVLCQTFNGDTRSWCRTLTPRNVGDRWEERLANGQTQTFSILKGRLLLNFLTGTGKDPHILSPHQYPDYPPDPSKAMKDIGGAASR